MGLSATLLVMFLWSCMLPIDSAELMHYLPRTKIPNSDFVLAHYAEPSDKVRKSIQLIKKIPSIAAFSPQVIIYTKGPEFAERDPHLVVLRKVFDADIIRTLSNRDRESATYLSHIIDYYDELA